MLQFLLTDYLTGYRLPSLRKTVTASSMVIWTLTTQPNRYTLLYPHVINNIRWSSELIDHCCGETIAVRLSDGIVCSLLEDGSERTVYLSAMESSCDKNEVISKYLTEEE